MFDYIIISTEEDDLKLFLIKCVMDTGTLG